MSTLKQMLDQHYGPARTGEGGLPTYRIDDQGPDDHYGGFWRMHLTLTGPDRFSLSLVYLPLVDEIIELLESRKAEVKDYRGMTTAKIRLTTKDLAFIRKLATAVRRLIGRGRRYPDRNWKWQCPRAADSLEQFADHLRTCRQASNPDSKVGIVIEF